MTHQPETRSARGGQQTPHANDRVPIRVWDFHQPFTESRHHAVRQCLHGPHGRVYRNGYPHAIWHGRFSAGRVQNWLGGIGQSLCTLYPVCSRPARCFAINTRAVDAPGHSPLGALSIIALLVSLLVQISTGLFANDDIFTEGPLASGHLGDVPPTHSNSRDQYLDSCGLIALHLSAISYDLDEQTPYLARCQVANPRKQGRQRQTIQQAPLALPSLG